MDDITERLRATCETGCDPELIYEAADALDALRKEYLLLRSDRDLEKKMRKDAEEDAERYRKWRRDYTDNNETPTEMMTAVSNAWTPTAVDAAIDAGPAVGIPVDWLVGRRLN